MSCLVPPLSAHSSRGSFVRQTRLSRAMAVPPKSPRTPPPSLDIKTLEYLEAIFRTGQFSPNLDQALRLPEVLGIVGISKSTWYARLNARSPSYDPRAPKPFKLGTSERSPSAWWRSAVMAYVRACANTKTTQ